MDRRKYSVLSVLLYVLLSLTVLFRADVVRADLILQVGLAGEAELTGYDGVQKQSLFKGALAADAEQQA